MPLDVFGTSNVNCAGPRSARSLTALISAGVAAVRLATTSTRTGWSENSMRNSLRRVTAGAAESTPLVQAGVHARDPAHDPAVPVVGAADERDAGPAGAHAVLVAPG